MNIKFVKKIVKKMTKEQLYVIPYIILSKV